MIVSLIYRLEEGPADNFQKRLIRMYVDSIVGSSLDGTNFIHCSTAWKYVSYVLVPSHNKTTTTCNHGLVKTYLQTPVQLTMSIHRCRLCNQVQQSMLSIIPRPRTWFLQPHSLAKRISWLACCHHYKCCRSLLYELSKVSTNTKQWNLPLGTCHMPPLLILNGSLPLTVT